MLEPEPWTVGCRRADDGDACEQALARLARISGAWSMAPLSAAQTKDMLEGCRHHTHASDDPILRCAMESDSDEATGACINAVLKAVLKPTGGRGSGSPGGINPLLDPSPGRSAP